MRILILGATGRIGALAVDRALDAGHEVVALVRDAATVRGRAGLLLVAGDIGDREAIRNAVKDVDAVIAAVGPRSNTAHDELAVVAGMRNLVAAMTASGTRRLVALSGAGIDVPHDQKPLLDRVASRIVRQMARHVVGAKQREYEIMSAADLDWTALRPPLVADGPPRGYRLDVHLEPGARVRRADVASALVDQLAEDRFYRAGPFVLPPRDGASADG